MELKVTEKSGIHFVEGPPGLPLIRSVDDATLVVEACFSHRVALPKCSTPPRPLVNG